MEKFRINDLKLYSGSRIRRCIHRDLKNEQQAMESAIQTLNQLAASHSTPKNFKKTISRFDHRVTN